MVTDPEWVNLNKPEVFHKNWYVSTSSWGMYSTEVPMSLSCGFTYSVGRVYGGRTGTRGVGLGVTDGQGPYTVVQSQDLGNVNHKRSDLVRGGSVNVSNGGVRDSNRGRGISHSGRDRSGACEVCT